MTVTLSNPEITVNIDKPENEISLTGQSACDNRADIEKKNSMKHLVYLSLGLLLCLAAGDAMAAPAIETAGQVLAKLAKMTPEQRQKTLGEKAKAEGDASLYSSLHAQ